MAVTIIERPYKCSWSKNDIRYVFQMDNLERPSLRLQVKLMWASPHEQPGYEELVTLMLTPDNDGYIYLYLQAYLDSVLDYVLPDPAYNVLFTIADRQACLFYVQYREMSDGVETPDFDFTEDTEDYRQFCLKGGIEKHKHSRNNYFNYFNTSKPFLTWQPGGRTIDRNEVICLTFLNPGYLQWDYFRSFSVELIFTDVSGATGATTIDLNNNEGLLFHLRLPVSSIDLPDEFFVSTLYSIIVRIHETASETILSSFTYFMESYPVYQFYDLIYHNSLGGIDFVRVKGETDESFDRTTEDAESGFSLNDWTAPVMSGESIYSSIQLQRKYKGDIGYLRTKGMQYALLDLLVSTSIYQLIDWHWVPLISLQKSQELGARRSYLNSFPIEWALSESNQVFTPIDFYLPKGNLL